LLKLASELGTLPYIRYPDTKWEASKWLAHSHAVDSKTKTSPPMARTDTYQLSSFREVLKEATALKLPSFTGNFTEF
jgi:hypothetical protein